MAGYGRNVPVYRKIYNHIELLDGSEELVQEMPSGVKKHLCKIQEFDWGTMRYDCILGVWCLGYLNITEHKTVLAGMQGSIKPSGYIILMEPVLKNEDEVDEKFIAEKGQWLRARKTSYYTKLFQQLQIPIYKTYHYAR